MTSLDLLVFVFAALAAVGLLSVTSMFLAESNRFKTAAFYVTAVLGLYACSICLRIYWPDFMFQSVAGMILGALGLFAMVIEFAGRKNRTQFLATRGMAAVSMVGGIFNALIL